MPADHCKKFFTKIPNEEPTFTLRGNDKLAVATIAAWIRYARAEGVNKEKIDDVQNHINEMLEYQRQHPERVKIPD